MARSCLINPLQNHQLSLKAWCSIILCTILVQITVAQRAPDVSYRDLQRLNATCYPRDSCRVARLEDSLKTENCNCGQFCVRYDTCCVDSRYRKMVPARRFNNYDCGRIYGIFPTKRVFMVSQCPRRWGTGDDYVKAMCAGDAQELSDPMLMMPVTNLRSRTTYRNYFCALCNGEDSKRDNVFWPLEVTTYGQNFSGFPDLAYDSENFSWKIRGMEDVFTSVKVKVPERLERSITDCREDVVSECASNWPNDAIRKKCSAYMALIRVEDPEVGYITYRNIHCAICNGKKGFPMICEAPSAFGGFGGSFGGGSRRPISFAHLLDVNRSDGDVVGEIRRCANTELYDPFAKKCRTVKCAIPGFVIKNGSCARV